MWGRLQDPGHIEFYEELHTARQRETEEDWMPMVRAIEHLQSIPEASRLYAFTSLWRFHITTAPGYEECDMHCSVTIVWRWQERRFHIALGRLADGWVDDRAAEMISDESNFGALIEPFIQRLLVSSPAR